MLQGLEALQATGAVLRRPYYLAVLAEVYGRQQQAREGLTLLTAALEVVHKGAERIHEAELYRLKGELLLQQWQVQGSRCRLPTPSLLPSTRKWRWKPKRVFSKALVRLPAASRPKSRSSAPP